MTASPLIDIFVRHSAVCERRGDERWKCCNCRKHLRWSWEGKQYRRTAKTRSWTKAERAKRELELKYEKAQFGKSAEDTKVATVEEAIAAFMADKRGGKAAAASLSKYKLTLSRFQEFCDRHNLQFMREIKLEHLSQWREEWQKYYGSALALRNNQSRVRHFFRYCKRARMIDDNPAPDLSAIKVTDDDFEVDPFTEKDYKTILKAIPACDAITALNRERVSALMQLQRGSRASTWPSVLACADRNHELERRANSASPVCGEPPARPEGL